MESAIYEGLIRHDRHLPVKNGFQYRMFMVYLDLAELDTVFKWNPFWSVERYNLASFLRRDHMAGSKAPLDEAVRALVKDRLGTSPKGPIRLLTHLRYFGHCFNPVSFYYCFDEAGRRVETVVAEINNTPWHEQHCYVLGQGDNEGNGLWRRHCFPKSFHVSPFMDMEIDYDWRFREPGQTLRVHMSNFKEGRALFDAHLSLERAPITNGKLTSLLVRYPVMTIKVVAAIYWQALKLKRKKVPFFPHPQKFRGHLEEV
ncbi:MAG: DUF1365 domain-containing protein [Planctomycetota bacterium]